MLSWSSGVGGRIKLNEREDKERTKQSAHGAGYTQNTNQREKKNIDVWSCIKK